MTLCFEGCDRKRLPPATPHCPAKPLNLQPEGGGRGREGVIRRSDRGGAESDRDRQMKRVERSKWNRVEADQEIAGIQRMPIFQGMDLEKSVRDIIIERGRRPTLRAGVDVAVAAPAREKAAKLDHREPANRN